MTIAIVPAVSALVAAALYLGMPDGPPRWRADVRALALYAWAACVFVVMMQVGGAIWRP